MNADDFVDHYFVSMNNDNRMDVHTIVPVVPVAFVYLNVKAGCIQHGGYYPANDSENVSANENANANVNDYHSNSRPNRSDYCDMRLKQFVWALMVVYVAMTHYIFALYVIQSILIKYEYEERRIER